MPGFFVARWLSLRARSLARPRHGADRGSSGPYVIVRNEATRQRLHLDPHAGQHGRAGHLEPFTGPNFESKILNPLT
jgi:hypothetical protein